MAIHPTLVVCWDRPETDWRAYQFLEPDFMYAGAYEARNHPGCDEFRDYYIQTLDVSFPILFLSGLGMRTDIDEVLPRPAAPE